jgi:hypothetical protein
LICFCFFIYGRASFAMKGKHVVPMEISFMDDGEKALKYGTLRPLRYLYSNPFRLLISLLGLPIFFHRIAKREQLVKMTPATAY